MKKFKYFFLFALFLSLFNVQDVHAQGFFKKLAKAAGEVLETAAAISGSNDNSSTSGNSTGKIPNVNFQITKCEYWGNGGLVRFLLTNTLSEDLEIIIDNSTDDENYVALDENNNKHAFAVVVGGKELTGLGSGYSAKLPAGVPVKGYFEIGNVSTSCTTIKSLTFGGRFANPVNGGSRDKYTYHIGSQTITFANNTNGDNIFLSYPPLNYTYTKAYRNGNNVVLEGTLTNKSVSEISMTGLFNDEQSQVYDSEGNSYNVSLVAGSNTVSSFYSASKFPVDIPVKCKVIIENVPTTIHEFSLVKKYFEIGGEPYYLQFRNLKF